MNSSSRNVFALGSVTMLAAASILITGCSKESGGGAATSNDNGGAAANDEGGTTPPTVSGPEAIAANYPADRANPAPDDLPNNWYDLSLDEWVGKNWYEISLFRLMDTFPEGLDSGKRYVTFYQRTCDHCEAMFYEDIAVNAELAAMTSAIEIPQDKTVMTGEGAWPLPDGIACELLELPLGPTYVVTSPLVLRIEDGVVTCVEEGDHRECMQLDQ